MKISIIKIALEAGVKTVREMQEKAIELLMDVHSLFLTGTAGTGKSYTVKKWLSSLKK